MREIGIGIIGANPDTGWALLAHAPAIEATDGVRVSAVATTREDSARRAARMVGDAAWYTDADQLAGDPDVDLVLVSVKVPHHEALIQAAVRAGKAVLSEWPLGLSTAQADLIAAGAAQAGVRGFAGLQGRSDPAIRAAAEIISSGELGEPLALSVRSSRAGGETIATVGAYTLDEANAAGNLEVHGGHLIDLLQFLLPELTVTSGRTSLVRFSRRVAETGEPVTATSPDTFTAAVSLDHAGRGIGSITAWDGDPAAGTEILVAGTAGRLRLWGTEPESERLRQPQMAPFAGELITHHSIRQLTPTHSDLPTAARNIAPLYAAIVADLREGTTTAPSFEQAVTLHRTLDTIRSPSR